MTKILVSRTRRSAARSCSTRSAARKGDDVSFHVVVPQARPRTATSSTTRWCDSAQVRVDLARAWMRDNGISSSGEVGDPTLQRGDRRDRRRGDRRGDRLDAAGASSGWLRRDLPEKLRQETGLPVEHVVVDLASEGLPFGVTLVAANVAASGDGCRAGSRSSPPRARGASSSSCAGPRPRHAVAQARERLDSSWLAARGRDRGRGMIGDPDPYRRSMTPSSTSTSPRS